VARTPKQQKEHDKKARAEIKALEKEMKGYNKRIVQIVNRVQKLERSLGLDTEPNRMDGDGDWK